MSELPDELVVMELVTRLPGKQVARCKCVCKLWRSMIGSARFKDVYGSRHRGLICHWVELDVKRVTKSYQRVTGWRGNSSLFYQRGLEETPRPSQKKDHLSFNYSPIRGLKEPDEEGFKCLYKLEYHSLYRSQKPVIRSEMVNSLLCVDQFDGFWIYNVCTGERMKILESAEVDYYSYSSSSSFHLGYDPSTRVYKLLRLMEPGRRALIITLGSSSMWRELNPDASCIPAFPGVYWIDWSPKYRVSPTDGFLCWSWGASTRSLDGLVLFDVSKEKFHKILLPHGYVDDSFRRKQVCVRAQFMEHNKRLAVSVWCIYQGVVERSVYAFSCFVMHDDEGKRWSKHGLEFPTMVCKEDAVLVPANWNSCEMVMMGSHGSNVYCYGRDHKMSRFQIGKLPNGVACLHSSGCALIASSSYLFDANNLYLPLQHILAGRI